MNHYIILLLTLLPFNRIDAMDGVPNSDVTDRAIKSANSELFNSIGSDSIERTTAALEKGAKVNAQDEHGRTPLMWAIMIASPDVSGLLIRKGANVASKDDTGMTPLAYAAYVGDQKGAEMLVASGANVNEATGMQSPLCQAILNHNLLTAGSLLSKGADPNMHLPQDRTPLSLAAASGDIEILDLLLKHKANINDLNSVALISAIRQGQKEATEFLLKNGADVNVKDEGSATPLMRAVVHGDRRMVTMLIAHGADVDAKDIDGMTPLGFAHERAMKELAELLSAKGAKDPGKRVGTRWSEAPTQPVDGRHRK
jgi:ankyrin repeat protein